MCCKFRIKAIENNWNENADYGMVLGFEKQLLVTTIALSD
jgi:hypothetical protein